MPTRVCDRCYNDIDGILSGTGKLSGSSIIDDSELGSQSSAAVMMEERPERQRPRRSSVVDDLAHRVKTSPLKCP